MPDDESGRTNPLISSIAYTPAVKAAQERLGSRRVYAKMEARGEERPWQDTVTPELAEFVAQRDSLQPGHGLSRRAAIRAAQRRTKGVHQGARRPHTGLC